MATVYGTGSIVTEGLILCLDAANVKSYPGSGTTWTDLTTNDNDVTSINSPTYSNDNAGFFGFNGSNQYFIGSSRSIETEFQYSDAFTASAFCRIKENTASGYIINNRFQDASGTRFAGWAINQDGGKIGGFVGGYPSSVISWRIVQTSTSSFSSSVYNKWCHITYTNTGTAGQQKIYLNAVDSSDIIRDDTNPPYTVNYSSGASRINIGKDGDSTEHLNADIAQISVYNRALAESEIQQNFNALKVRFGL